MDGYTAPDGRREGFTAEKIQANTEGNKENEGWETMSIGPGCRTNAGADG
jgi:hypothetical protein